MSAPECERCGEPLNTGTRYCSRECFNESVADGTFAPLPPMTFEEMQAEMEGVFARLRSYPEEAIE